MWTGNLPNFLILKSVPTRAWDEILGTHIEQVITSTSKTSGDILASSSETYPVLPCTHHRLLEIRYYSCVLLL